MWSAADSALLKDSSVLSEEVSSCTASVCSGTTTLLALVESLGEVLKHSDVARRKAGLDFLCRVLEGLPEGKLSSDECSFLVTFLLDRLKDRAVMFSPVIRGLRAVAVGQQGTVAKEDFARVVWMLLDGETIQAQSFTLEDRRKIYDVLTLAVRNHLRDNLDRERFLLGFASAVQGETNAKNLFAIFNAWPAVIRSVPKLDTLLEEETFSALECYYPIDYSGSQDGISKKDLSEALRRCLLATPKFGVRSIDLFLEKLDSDLPPAKTEALLCLREATEAFSIGSFELRMNLLWNSCKREIMGIQESTSKSTVREAKYLIRDVTKMACSTPRVLDKWVDLIWRDLRSFLGFLESKLLKTAADILCIVISASSGQGASARLCDEAVENLLGVMKRKDADQVHLARVLLRFLEAGAISSKNRAEIVSSLKFRLSCDDPQACGQWVRILVVLQAKAPDEEVKQILKECFQKYVKCGGDSLALGEKESLIAQLIKDDEALPVTEWCDSLTSKESALKDDELKLLSTLCANYDAFFEKIAPRLVDLGEFGALESVWDKKASGESEMDKLLELCLGQGNQSTGIMSSAKSTGLLRKMGRTLGANRRDWIQSVLGHILASTSKSNAALARNSAALLCSLKPEVVKSLDIKAVFQPTESIDAECLAKVRSSILNKLWSTEMQGLFNRVKEDSVSIEAESWVAKGLVMRGIFDDEAVLQFFRNLGKSDQEGNIAAALLNVLSDDDDLSRDNHHLVLPFYKQRFFQRSLSAMKDLFEETRNPVFLEAAVCQLPSVPASAARPLVLPLVPLLSESLVSGGGGGRTNSKALSGFLSFVRQLDSTAASEAWERLVPFLLKVASAESGGASVEERAYSLEAVDQAAAAAAGSKDKELVLRVTSSTAPLLDDGKRVIRKAAADARNAWLLV